MLDLYVGEAAAMIAKLAAEIGASIIHAPSDFLTAHAALAAARVIDVPFVLDHAERVPEIVSPSIEVQHSERFDLFQKLQHTLAQEADAVVARTAVLRQMLLDGGLAASQVRQLFDAMSPPDAARSKPAATQHPALAGRKVVGFIGEAGAEFDLPMLPALLAKVVQGGVDAALHVIGAGSPFERLQVLANELGVGDRLALPGRPKLHDIAGHYALMDVVVLPYRSRSWRAPYELVEAMAHGACVVSPDFADVREIMGESGVVVAPDAMADAIAGLLRDDERRARLAISAKKRAAELFELEQAGHSLLQVYVQAWKRAGGIDGAAPGVRTRSGLKRP
jgi:glycosyltransferase involved in cell wall biosynthesis